MLNTLVFHLAFLLAIPVACSSVPRLAPSSRAIKTWAGDSQKAAIVRGQDKVEISCQDPRFDGFAALTYEDLTSLAGPCRCEK